MNTISTVPTSRVGENLTVQRMPSGLWQVAGGHGTIEFDKAVAAMRSIYDAGFTTFDMADHYGPAEDIAGAFFEGVRQDGFPGGKPQIMTKWVPEPGAMDMSVVRTAIRRSLDRLKTDCIDLIQFHWWDYLDPGYLPAVEGLFQLKEEGLIREVGLTNFDTAHARILVEMGFPVVSNQVHFSLLDERPRGDMTTFCNEHNVKLLCYGTVAGGFLSERWLGVPEPSFSDVSYSWSLMKYLRFIHAGGGWGLFQRLLEVLDGIAKKHGVGISNIATRWVLDQEAVAAVLIGTRLGISEHLAENRRTFDITLDEDDHAALADVKAGFTPLHGDCGDEYRKPPFLTAAGDLSDHKTHAWRMPLMDRYPGEDPGRGHYNSKTVWEDIASFSRAVRQGNVIHVSGTTATLLGKVVPPGSAASQAEVCIDKIEAALEALGGRLEDVIRTRVYVPDLEEDWEAVARVHGRRFAGIDPANTLIGASLVGEGYLVEMEAEAVIPPRE